MLDGITSQYGFLFQKYIFMDTAISHASMDLYFVYEGIDDIDIVSTDGANGEICLISLSNNNYIQVKSGTINKESWAKVLGNWILTESFPDASFTLASENELNFSVFDEDTIDYVYEYFESGSSKKSNSISKKVYDKIFEEYDEEEIKNIIKELTAKCDISTKPMEVVINHLRQKFFETYCPDIKIYEKAKSCRFERFLEYLLYDIEDSIQQKKKYILTFPHLMEVIIRVQSEISDEKYSVNTSEIRKRKKKDVERLVQRNDIREIRQLKLVKDDNAFIASELVNELLYRDFREVYSEGGIEIANIEDIAYTNYLDACLEFEGTPTARELFTKTTNKGINSSLMENSPIYRKGCYIYLTGQEVEAEKQITWGDDDE